MVRSFLSKFSPQSERRLLALCKNNPDKDREIEKWNKAAVQYLVRKLRKESDILSDLEKAIKQKSSKTKCVPIPKVLDNRLLISHRRGLPQVVYCRIWRWPDLQSHHQIRAISTCQSSTHTTALGVQHPPNSDTVCVNPFHYERESPGPIDPIILSTRIPPDLSSSVEETDSKGTRARPGAGYSAPVIPSLQGPYNPSCSDFNEHIQPQIITRAKVDELLLNQSQSPTAPLDPQHPQQHEPPSTLTQIASVDSPAQISRQSTPPTTSLALPSQSKSALTQRIEDVRVNPEAASISGPTNLPDLPPSVPSSKTQEMDSKRLDDSSKELSDHIDVPIDSGQLLGFDDKIELAPGDYDQGTFDFLDRMLPEVVSHPEDDLMNESSQGFVPKQEDKTQHEATSESANSSLMPLGSNPEQSHQVQQRTSQPISHTPPQQHHYQTHQQQQYTSSPYDQYPYQSYPAPYYTPQQHSPQQQAHHQQMPVQHSPQQQQPHGQSVSHIQQSSPQPQQHAQQKQQHQSQQMQYQYHGKQPLSPQEAMPRHPYNPRMEVASPYSFNKNRYTDMARAKHELQSGMMPTSYDQLGPVNVGAYGYQNAPQQHVVYRQPQYQQSQMPPPQQQFMTAQQQQCVPSTSYPQHIQYGQIPATSGPTYTPLYTSQLQTKMQQDSQQHSQYQQTGQMHMDCDMSVVQQSQPTYYNLMPGPSSGLVDQSMEHMIDIQQVPFQEGTSWCSITYHEYGHRLGDKYQTASNIVSVDGYTQPVCSDRFCIGGLSNVNRNQFTEWVRRRIGRGVKLTYVDGEVFVESQCESALFVSNPLLIEEHGGKFIEQVTKLSEGCSLKVFSTQQFSKLLSDSVTKGFESVYKLTNCCIIRISFVKGWGRNYKRQSIFHTPCWVEIQLNGPLQWIDKVLRQMKPPPGCGTTSK